MVQDRTSAITEKALQATIGRRSPHAISSYAFELGGLHPPKTPGSARERIGQISSIGLGRPKKKPWAWVKPMRMQTSASSAVSTPSATV